MKRTFVFGYGSLLYASGINGRGMKRYYRNADLTPCTLTGFQRGAYLNVGKARFYSIVPKKGSNVVGAMFEIHSKSDLTALLADEGVLGSAFLPEPTYVVQDVTTDIADTKLPEGTRVLTLVHPPERILTDGVLHPKYQDHVWNGIQHLGPEFANKFLQTGGRGGS